MRLWTKIKKIEPRMSKMSRLVDFEKRKKIEHVYNDPLLTIREKAQYVGVSMSSYAREVAAFAVQGYSAEKAEELIQASICATTERAIKRKEARLLHRTMKFNSGVAAINAPNIEERTEEIDRQLKELLARFEEMNTQLNILNEIVEELQGHASTEN